MTNYFNTDNGNHTTGKPLSSKPNPTREITGTIPSGLKNLKKECIQLIREQNQICPMQVQLFYR